MRAAVLRGGRLVARDDVDEPVPGPGQVLVEVKACGICGSDLHFAQHGHEMLDLGAQMEGSPSLGSAVPDLDRDVFLGHEFAAEVLEHGPGAEAPKPGTIVTSLPVLLTPAGGIEAIVYSNTVLGGFSERMLLSQPLLLEVPNGLDPKHAALTEPMAVGLHAVNKSGVQAGEGALVLGCGPVGLAVIAHLKRKGVGPIVATDLSPARRRLAQVMGADEAVDPREEPAFAAWARAGRGTPAVFEAIGVPGILDDAMRRAPAGSRITVVGVCMQPDAIHPYFGIAKELEVRFVLGYDPLEFAESLRSIAEGEVDVAPLITDEVGLDEVDRAFAALADPEAHCKVLVVP